MIDRIPHVFISYSQTSKDYKQKVKTLAERLIHDGINVELDIWDLKEGQNKYVYMERCVNDEKIDKVLILSDKIYAIKADSRRGGVGDETTIISPEIYKNVEQQKFIPVVMEHDENGEAFLPAYLKSILYIDLSGESYESEYKKLVRSIYEEPLERKPELGDPPRWLKHESTELYSVREATNQIRMGSSETLRTIEANNFVYTYIDSLKHFFRENYNGPEEYISDFTEMKEYRDSFLDCLKDLSMMGHFGEFMAEAFEDLYNNLTDIRSFKEHATGYTDDCFDIFKLHIWELFICTTAFMLHNGMYQDIHELLYHTYFLRKYPTSDSLIQVSYEKFRFHSRLMEERFKPKLPDPFNRKYTLVGHYIVNEREYLPIYSKKALVDADLFLYQVYYGMELDQLKEWSPWFPMLYVYANTENSMWRRIQSEQYCKRIMPIFGVKTVADFIERVRKCKCDERIRYSDLFAEPAPAILSIISFDEIAKLP